MMRILPPLKDMFTRIVWVLATTILSMGTLSAQTFVTNGTAYNTGVSGGYVLTQAQNGQNGSIWYNKQIDIRQPFILNFNINQGNNPSGADGMAFVFQQVGTAVQGSSGSGMGYGGISPSIAVEYDTYVNGDYQGYDPPYDHMGLMLNGQYHHQYYGADLISPVPLTTVSGGNVKDGQYHNSIIEWIPSKNTLVVTYDGRTMFVYAGNILNYFPNGPAVYFGFTASTGGLNNLHAVDINLAASSFTEFGTTPPPSIVSVSSTADLCTGANRGTATVTATNGTQPYSISVGALTQTGIYSNTGTPSATALFTNLSPGTYPVTVTDANNIQVSSYVTVDPAPPAPTSFNVSGGGSICTNSPASTKSIDLSGSQLGVNYLLYKNSVPIGTAIVGTGAPISFTVSEAGTYSIIAQNNFGNRCSTIMYGVASVDIVVMAIPTIIANGPTTVCAPGTVTLKAEASGTSFLWNTGETSQSIDVSTSGDYSYSVISIRGCTIASAATTVTINPLPSVPVIAVPNPSVFCGPQLLTLTASNGSNYAWTMTVATAADKNNVSLDATLGVGNNTFTVSNTSNDGCVSISAPVSVMVKAAPISYVVSGDNKYCFGNGSSTINLSNSESSINYEIFNNGVSVGLNQIGTGGSLSFTAPTVIGTNVYTIVATNNITNCVTQMSGSATIQVNPLPSVPAITSSTNAVCVGASIQLQNTETGGNWSSANSSIASIDGSGNVIGMGVGTVQIGYAITNSSGCTYGAVTNITVNPTPTKPIITANGPTNFCPKGSVQISSDVSNGNRWSISNANTQTITISKSGNYLDTVTNQYGCYAVSNTIMVDATDRNAPVPSITGTSLPDLKNVAMNATINVPTAIDDCDGTITASTINPVAYSKPGTYIITWTYTDNSGNSSTQSQTVTVVDIIPPTIAILPNILQNAGKDSCSAVVNYPLPTINDNVSSTPISISDGYGDNSILFDLPLTNSVSNLSFTSSGEYQDIAHGHGESINVTVSLYNPLTTLWTDIQTIQTGNDDYHFGGTNTNFTVITQVSKIRFTSSKVIGAALHFYNLLVNLNSIGLNQIQGLPSGSVFPVGKTTNTFTATDQAGNSSSISFDVTIVDVQKPVILPINSVSKSADVNGSWKGSAATITVVENCSSVSLNEQYVDANGNVIATKLTNNIGLSYTLGAQLFPLGVNKVVLTAIDAAGNISDPVSFNITVVDNTNPSITTVVNVIQSNDPGVCGAYVKVPTPLATDNVGLKSFTNDYTKGSTAVAYYPVGTTIITWTAIDMNGNALTATQTVTVKDTEIPVFTSLPVDIAQSNDWDACTATVTWPAVNVTDNCGAGTGATNLTIVADHSSGERFPIGTTKVTYTATDIHGNIAKASFNVVVTDNQAPKAITQSKTVTLRNGVATISAADINNASYDNCGAVTLSVSKTNFTCNDIGVVPVILTVTDQYSNSSTATAMVTVVGQTLSSSISVTPSSTVYTGGVPTDIYIGYGSQSATITDNVIGAPTSYSWSGAGLSCTNCAAPVFTASSTGLNNFSVTASNQYGCTTTSTVAFCVRDIRVSATANSDVSICHTDLNTGATSTVQLAVSKVATQLTQNPQDKLGACGLLPCTSNLITVSVAPIETVQMKSIKQEDNTEEKLTVKVSPNPSNNVFVLVISSSNKSKVSLRMTDLNGRVMETRENIALNMPVKVGGDLIAGIYFAEVIQGNERVAVKLIKQNR